MSAEFDLIVLGAGPAGAAAAIEARRHALNVAVIDENTKAGGQIYRAPSFPISAGALRRQADLRAGEQLREALDASGATLLFGHKVWLSAPGIEVMTFHGDKSFTFRAKRMIVATGTTERLLPVPGATLPGVIGLAAATILLKAHACVPGAPTVVAGVGPLLYAVAAGIMKGGGRVACIVDMAHPAEWAATLPAMLRRPDLLRRGLAWMLRLRAQGVPIRFGHKVTQVHGDTCVTAVTIRAVDRAWRIIESRPPETIAAASVAMGHGLVPATEVARIMGVRHAYRANRGGWVPEVGADRSTDVDGLYIAGDCAGISGAAAASVAGTLAGLAAARDLQIISANHYARVARIEARKLRRAEVFGFSMSALMTVRQGLIDNIADDTIVCRCEDITRASIDAATRRGVRDANQLKSTTRCGMGPCQGRMCGDAAAELIASATGRPRCEVGHWTARVPLRVVPMTALVGDYRYEDIPRQAAEAKS